MSPGTVPGENRADDRAAQDKLRLDAVHQVQAIANLFSMIPVQAMVPFMGDAAASADLVLVLVEELLSRSPGLVVECGSGVSTLWLALAARQFGLDTRIVALEHLSRYAAATRAVLRRHGVDHLVDVRDAPLEPTWLAGHATPWYAASALADTEGIGLLVVDGPPGAIGPLARWPAVPLLRDRFAPNVSIVLDDTIRSDEQAVVARWRTLLPDFVADDLPLEKGASILRRG